MSTSSLHEFEPDALLRHDAWSRARAATCAALLAAATTAQGWQPVTDAVLPTAALRIAEPGGALVAEGDRVLRERGGERSPLECTLTGGPGTIRAMAGSRAGTTFVAASNGLFAVHPEVDTLDLVALGDGAPAGAPVGVASDRVDRLWLATERAVGPVHAGFWFGRTHGEADGLPSPPYRGLALAADGALLLAHDGGVHRYAPDPAPPRLVHAAAAGTADGVQRLELEGEAAGGATFRFRHAAHHLLRSIDGCAVRLHRAGRNELVVHAVDRDLDLSTPVRVAVAVPYPRSLPALLLAIGGCAAALAFAAYLYLARRLRLAFGRALLGGGLLLVLLLQLSAAVADVGRTWPFLGFGMYGEVYREDDVLFTPAIVQRGVDGSWRPAAGGILAFATDGVWRHLTALLYDGDAAREAFRRGLGEDACEVELRIRRCRLTRAGPREVAPWVLARFPEPDEVR